MTIENNDKQKATVDSAPQQQPQTVQQAGQQQKQASPHDKKTCTNPDHHHGKEKTVSDATKPNQDGKPAR